MRYEGSSGIEMWRKNERTKRSEARWGLLVYSLLNYNQQLWLFVFVLPLCCVLCAVCHFFAGVSHQQPPVLMCAHCLWINKKMSCKMVGQKLSSERERIAPHTGCTESEWGSYVKRQRRRMKKMGFSNSNLWMNGLESECSEWRAEKMVSVKQKTQTIPSNAGRAWRIGGMHQSFGAASTLSNGRWLLWRVRCVCVCTRV